MIDQPPLPFGDPLLDIVRQDRENFLPTFAAWLAENMHVWRAFEREADKVWNRGRRHYSARTILEHLRHETALADNGVEFKLNNNVAPDLARLYRLRYPDRADLFEVRRVPGSERAA